MEMRPQVHVRLRLQKVLLIGWDAADWKVIEPLAEAGEMPNLQKLVDGGVMGNIATLQPALSPMLWTSIATGKRALKHGGHGFGEPCPNTGAIRPLSLPPHKKTPRSLAKCDRQGLVAGAGFEPTTSRL